MAAKRLFGTKPFMKARLPLPQRNAMF